MSDVTFFYAGWDPIGRIVVVGVLMYATLVLFLRLSGSRTLSSMNAFDFIVTVAIGSVFGRALTAKDVALAEAVAAFALLVGLQYGVAWAQTRWPSFSHIVTNPPTLLYFEGEFLHDAMRRERVTQDEIIAQVRLAGHAGLNQVAAVVLETAGDFSVMGRDGSVRNSALRTVHNADRVHPTQDK